jgi:hypothetical protein
MASIATIVALLAAAGAVASWIIGAVFYARALAERAERSQTAMWLSVVAWPFALARVRNSAGASRLNKALVAFLACAMIGAAATSVATNLHRMSK